MMRPAHYYDFFNPSVPPLRVNLRVDSGGLQFQDLLKQWPVKKSLSSRDINYSQIVLPREQVEEHILPLLFPEERNLVNRGQQFQITVRDLDTLRDFKLFLWENGRSYVLTNGWTTSFVRRRRLEVGEEVGFFWNRRLRVLFFSVLSRQPVPH